MSELDILERDTVEFATAAEAQRAYALQGYQGEEIAPNKKLIITEYNQQYSYEPPTTPPQQQNDEDISSRALLRRRKKQKDKNELEEVSECHYLITFRKNN